MTANTFINAIQNFEPMKIDEIIDKISEGVINGNLTNNDLVQIIEQAGSYLNLATISDYAKNNNISYNGAKKFREKVKLFNVPFIIENE